MSDASQLADDLRVGQPIHGRPERIMREQGISRRDAYRKWRYDTRRATPVTEGTKMCDSCYGPCLCVSVSDKAWKVIQDWRENEGLSQCDYLCHWCMSEALAGAGVKAEGVLAMNAEPQVCAGLVLGGKA